MATRQWGASSKKKPSVDSTPTSAVSPAISGGDPPAIAASKILTQTSGLSPLAASAAYVNAQVELALKKVPAPERGEVPMELGAPQNTIIGRTTGLSPRLAITGLDQQLYCAKVKHYETALKLAIEKDQARQKDYFGPFYMNFEHIVAEYENTEEGLRSSKNIDQIVLKARPFCEANELRFENFNITAQDYKEEPFYKANIGKIRFIENQHSLKALRALLTLHQLQEFETCAIWIISVDSERKKAYNLSDQGAIAAKLKTIPGPWASFADAYSAWQRLQKVNPELYPEGEALMMQELAIKKAARVLEKEQHAPGFDAYRELVGNFWNPGFDYVHWTTPQR